MLRKLQLKTNYSSESDNLYTDFFLPALGAARVYQRAVGFYSLGVLLNTPSAMSALVGGDGRIELIFGKLVSVEDFDAIQQSMEAPIDGLDNLNFEEVVKSNPGSLLEYRVRILAWLFSTDRLEMKVAIRPDGMFHQKIGLLKDQIGDTISFSGSMNETVSALDPRYNSEEITVFKSWVDGQSDYVSNHSASFTKLWSGDTGSRTVVCPLPDALREGLLSVSEMFPGKPSSAEEGQRVREFLETKGPRVSQQPRVPDTLNDRPFEVRGHQLDALRAWSENDCVGILELATGAGKTITSIYGATKTIEANKGIVLVVAVPYQDLADQWCEALKHFQIFPIRCYGSRANWEPELQSYLRRNAVLQVEHIALVVVNRTLGSPQFQRYLNELDANRMFFIGDECHHHSGAGFKGKLPTNAKFRMGLSATPFHYLDEERNERLKSMYGESVFEYTLSDAIRDKVLTPYEYHPVPVELTEEETEEYIRLSVEIGKAFAILQQGHSKQSQEKLTQLLLRRSRLIGTARNKIPALERVLDSQDEFEPYSLFYCSDGRTLLDIDWEGLDVPDGQEGGVEIRQRFAVAELLESRNIKVSPFTSDENRNQRREILSKFREGTTEALVAIRCLDEGIDVPACKVAYLLASSSNPRQFVQRRGRILRRSDNKEYAKIYDFVAVLPRNTRLGMNDARDFLKKELERVAKFAEESMFPVSSVEPLKPWLIEYGLEHLV